MNTKRLASLLVIATLVLAAGPAMADSHTGTIQLYHLNSGVPGRGVCIRMTPALPDTGWACLWKGSSLYSEMTALLLEAYSARKTCTIQWSVDDPNGHALITIADCKN